MRKSQKPKEAEIDIDRLCYSMQRSRWALRFFRESRREMVREYVGSHWSEEGSYKTVPLNLLALYVSVVGKNLIAKNPRVMLSTFDRANKPAVVAMQTWANNEIVKMRLQQTLERAVLDALFSVGICKVALATPADSASVSWNLAAGQTFAEVVDLDDFVFDVHARDFSEVSYIGHRFRAPLAAVRDSKIYSKARLELTASDDPFFNLEGDERISVLGRTYYAGNDEEFEDMVDLWEVYLPRHRVVVTLVDNQLSAASATPTNDRSYSGALRIQNWLGPDGGPYHILKYGTVPGNAMPIGPIQHVYDLHRSTNELYRKLIRQAARQKEHTLYQRGDQDDAARIQQANDGEMVGVNNPAAAVVRSFGGPAQQNAQMAEHLKDLFDFFAGGLSLMGGLAPQSKTLGQDRMLNENQSHLVTDMQDTTVDFTADVVKSLCWYWWHDPFKVMKAKAQLPGLPDMGIQTQVTPQQRMRGRFEDLEIEVDPYSFQHQTPESRMAALNQVVTQIIVPMAQTLQAQGIQFDANAWLQKMAVYSNMPDLPDICTVAPPPQPDPQAAGTGSASGGPTQPAQTSREYIRRSVGNDTPANRTSTFQNAMAARNAPGQNGRPQNVQQG